MAITEREAQSIKIVEEELKTLDRIENGILGESKIQRTVDKYAIGVSLYSSPKRMQQLINELEMEIAAYLKATNNRAKLLSKSQIKRFLEESEKRDIAQKQLRIINNMNDRQARRRLHLALMELQKETGILKADIAIFRERAKISGLSNKDTLRQLVIASRDRQGIAQGFAKRVKKLTKDAVRREQSSAKIEERLKVAKPNENWVWIAISTKPCPDCVARAGTSLTYDTWVQKGLPGSGRTICQSACMCDLMPENMADDAHPTIREFTWNPKDTVLSTKSEIRTFKAKSHRSRLL